MRMARANERILTDEIERFLGVGLEGISEIFRKSVEFDKFSQHVVVSTGEDNHFMAHASAARRCAR